VEILPIRLREHRFGPGRECVPDAIRVALLQIICHYETGGKGDPANRVRVLDPFRLGCDERR